MYTYDYDGTLIKHSDNSPYFMNIRHQLYYHVI